MTYAWMASVVPGAKRARSATLTTSERGEEREGAVRERESRAASHGRAGAVFFFFRTNALPFTPAAPSFRPMRHEGGYCGGRDTLWWGWGPQLGGVEAGRGGGNSHANWERAKQKNNILSPVLGRGGLRSDQRPPGRTGDPTSYPLVGRGCAIEGALATGGHARRALSMAVYFRPSPHRCLSPPLSSAHHGRSSAGSAAAWRSPGTASRLGGRWSGRTG